MQLQDVATSPANRGSFSQPERQQAKWYREAVPDLKFLLDMPPETFQVPPTPYVMNYENRSQNKIPNAHTSLSKYSHLQQFAISTVVPKLTTAHILANLIPDFAKLIPNPAKFGSV